MRRILSIMLVLLVMAAIGMTALAFEEAGGDEEFYIEELPAFGEEDEISFAEDETWGVEPAVKSGGGQEPAEENDPPAEAPQEGQTAEGERAEEASSPAPADEAEHTEKNNLPVIIIIAVVLAAGVVAVLLAKKRRPAKPGHLDS